MKLGMYVFVEAGSFRIFPSPKGDGPIEAAPRHGSESILASRFPSPKGGGPIEARTG